MVFLLFSQFNFTSASDSTLCKKIETAISGPNYFIGIGAILLTGGVIANALGVDKMVQDPADNVNSKIVAIEYGAFCAALGTGLLTYGIMKRRELQAPNATIITVLSVQVAEVSDNNNSV